jgi:ABC-type dipeptide/oligopeptide/nickel transport system permease component
VLRAALLPIAADRVRLVRHRGPVVVETVFSPPGPVLDGGVDRGPRLHGRSDPDPGFAFGAMAINLATDLVYPLFDPRVRMG